MLMRLGDCGSQHRYYIPHPSIYALSVAEDAIALSRFCLWTVPLGVDLSFETFKGVLMVLFENEVPQWCGDVDGGLVFRR